MHDATCGDCGKQCQVPFEPRQDKPVYCNECFPKHKPQSRVAIEVVLTEDHEKCTRLPVEIVAKTVRFHSSQNKTSQFTVVSVFKTIKETKIILV